jgi:hypothetical protein
LTEQVENVLKAAVVKWSALRRPRITSRNSPPSIEASDAIGLGSDLEDKPTARDNIAAALTGCQRRCARLRRSPATRRLEKPALPPCRCSTAHEARSSNTAPSQQLLGRGIHRESIFISRLLPTAQKPDPSGVQAKPWIDLPVA